MKKLMSAAAIIIISFAIYCGNSVDWGKTDSVNKANPPSIGAKDPNPIPTEEKTSEPETTSNKQGEVSVPVASIPQPPGGTVNNEVNPSRSPAPINPVPSPNPSQVPEPTKVNQQVEMLGYINAARAKVHETPLTLDSDLSKGAYLKSKDMAVNGYFSHTSPTYGSPFAMMKSLGISYRIAGENIAQNGSVLGAHNAFMNSEGHRENILNPAFSKIGLGFYSRGNYLFVTQWFTD